MNKELTEIVLVVDRSGSMHSCREESENGINQFIKDQKEEDGKANFTLVEFDNKYEFVCEGIDIKDAVDYSLVPRGMTALNDAVGRSIAETGDRLSKMDEKDRPGLVAFVIVTDGLENSSHEYKAEKIKEMITTQQDTYNWQFTFLGAGLDAFEGGMSLGFSAEGSVNYDPSKINEVYGSTSLKMSRMRKMSSHGEAVDNTYTSAELSSMTGD